MIHLPRFKIKSSITLAKIHKPNPAVFTYFSLNVGNHYQSHSENNYIMSNIEKRQALFEKGIAIQTEATNKLLTQTVNHIILLGSSLVVILSTLSDPDNHNICIYRYLLCILLLSIFCGVICISIITIDYYNLGKKAQKQAEAEDHVDDKQRLIRTGKFYYFSILWTFLGCLISFLTSLVLLVIYAW
jgi:hypothetical protein